MKDITVLIGTKNRANGERGYPLNWTLESIKKQTCKPKVLVIDDYSNADQAIKTKELCDKYKVTYSRTQEPLGCSGVKREALDKIDTSYHIILDDDLLFYEEKAVENISRVLEETKKKVSNLGALIFPAYDRVPFPTKIIPKEKIGKIDTKQALTSWNLNSFPEEFIGTKVESILVETAGSYGIYNTELLKKLGGFRTGGKTDYAMESELAWRIIKEGNEIYYYPGLDTGALHLRFGIKSDISPQDFLKGLDNKTKELVENYFQKDINKIMKEIKLEGVSLEKIVDISNQNFNGTGCRVKEKEWVQERIENELGQIIAHYPKVDLTSALKNYIIRVFNHAKDFKISRRRGSLATPCIKDNSFNKRNQIKAIIKGIVGGIKKGIKWKKK